MLPYWARVDLGVIAMKGRSAKYQHHWNLTIKLFSVIFRTLVAGVLSFCREAVGVFYSPSQLRHQVTPWEVLPLCEMQSVYSTALADWATILSDCHCLTVDFAVLADHGEKMKESEKTGKCLDLAENLRNLRNMRLPVVSILIVGFGTILNCLERVLEESEIRGQIKTDKTTTLLRSTLVLRIVLCSR